MTHTDRTAYLPLDGISIRLPAFPIEMYRDLVDPQLQSRWNNDPQVRLALASASIALLEEQDRPQKSAKNRTHRDQKTLNYLIRMSTRATPFGLLAGVGLAHWDDKTAIPLADATRRTRTRADMHWLITISQLLESLPEIRHQLQLVANFAITMLNGRIYLPEKHRVNQSSPTTSVSIRATPIVLTAIKLAQSPIAYQDLLDTLHLLAPNVIREKVVGLIDLLLEQTFLLTDLRPPLTTFNSLGYIREKLKPIAAGTTAYEALTEIETFCAGWDANPLLQRTQTYQKMVQQAHAISQKIEALRPVEQDAPATPTPKPALPLSASWFQMDLAWSMPQATLSRRMQTDIAEAIDVLLRLAAYPQGSRHMEKLRQKFTDRFGEEREVPLLEALDSNRGVGLPESYSLLTQVHNTHDLQFSERAPALLDLAFRAFRDHALVIYLDEATIQSLAPNSIAPDHLPASLDYFCAIAALSATSIDEGNYLLVSGPGGVTLAARSNIGRFADVLGQPAIEMMTETAAIIHHQEPESLMAEMVYLPNITRLCNVAIVPQTYPYEITYGLTTNAHATAIPLNELTLSVHQQRFVLRWQRTGQHVVVQCSHLLNLQLAPGVIRFLLEMHRDQVCIPTEFSWEAAETLPFLPRVQYKKVVLRCAQWTISEAVSRHDLDLSDAATFRTSLATWCQAWQVPRYVYLPDRDRRLLLDLEDAQQRELLRTALQTKPVKKIIVQEALPGPEHAWISGPNGHYLSECVFSLVRRDLIQPPALPHSHLPNNIDPFIRQPIPTPAERLCPTGSDWLFMKIYVGQQFQRDLLIGPIQTLLQQLMSAEIVNQWFFIRYNDPEPHIRLRVQGKPEVLLHEALPQMCQWANTLCYQGGCNHYVFATYEREIERYGGIAAMPLAENIFAINSQTTLALLTLQATQKTALDLTALTLLSTNALLTDLGLSAENCRDFYRALSEHDTKSGEYYRLHGRLLRQLMQPHLLSQENVAEAHEIARIFTSQRQALAQAHQDWQRLAQQQQLTQSLSNLHVSFAHMNCNRMCGIDHEQELFVYAMLDRLYEGFRRSTNLPRAESRRAER